MSAQDLEQRARELLVKWRYAEPANGSMASQNRRDAFRRCANELESVLRHQPAPVDLEQFREAVECWLDAALPANDVEAERKAKAQRLLSIIDNAGKVACQHDTWEENGGARRCADCRKYLGVASCQPAPVVDDAMVKRAIVAYHDAGGAPSNTWAMRAALTAALARAQEVKS